MDPIFSLATIDTNEVSVVERRGSERLLNVMRYGYPPTLTSAGVALLIGSTVPATITLSNAPDGYDLWLIRLGA